MAGEGKRRNFVDPDTSRTELESMETRNIRTCSNDNANTNPPTTDIDTSSTPKLRRRQATATTTTRSTAVNPNANTARSPTSQPPQQDTARSVNAHETGSMTKKKKLASSFLQNFGQLRYPPYAVRIMEKSPICTQ